MQSQLNAGANHSTTATHPVRTILVAEDDPDDRFFLARAFAKAALPHALQFVHDGQAAVDYLKGADNFADRRTFPMPALLLLDLKMPKLDGFDVLQWLATAGHSQLPVFVLSGSALEADKRLALSLGARGYLVKTGDQAQTILMLKELAEKWLQPAPNEANAVPPKTNTVPPSTPRANYLV